jgi:CheY-like chemotaxis protein
MTALTLHGLRILVVEDNFVLADSLRYLLSSYDGTVVAIASTTQQAFAALATAPVDVAVLDIDLHGTSVAPFAEHLRANGIPFVFVTGYGTDPHPLSEDLRSYPRLDKPVDGDRLVRTLVDLTRA